MKIHRLYADKKGESHFEDVEVTFTESGRAGRLSPRLPATGIIFREVPPDYDLDWHPAPRRQYIINLDAGVEIDDVLRSEEHTSELQSLAYLVCRLLLEKKKARARRSYQRHCLAGSERA